MIRSTGRKGNGLRISTGRGHWGYPKKEDEGKAARRRRLRGLGSLHEAAASSSFYRHSGPAVCKLTMVLFDVRCLCPASSSWAQLVCQGGRHTVLSAERLKPATNASRARPSRPGRRFHSPEAKRCLVAGSSSVALYSLKRRRVPVRNGPPFSRFRAGRQQACERPPCGPSSVQSCGRASNPNSSRTISI